MEALVASRVIPLDKGEGGGGVRPIGGEEVVRRVISNCVMKVVKPDVMDASGPRQVCAGQTSGNEAAIHALRNIFDTDAILLIDASNAFNSLNRAVALHNLRILWYATQMEPAMPPKCRVLQRFNTKEDLSYARK